MKASIDISMYPLQDDYCEPILAFIEGLKRHPNIKVLQNQMSTQVFGEFRDLMAMMTEEVEAVLAEQPKTIFVLKLLGTDRSESDIDRCSAE